jgi:hypothetical protein
MNGERREGLCFECGRSVALATTTVEPGPECYTCYRRRRRRAQREAELIDRHTPGVRKEHRQVLRAHTGLLVALSELGVSHDRVLEILEIVNPYLESVRQFLTTTVDCEREPLVRVHVHELATTTEADDERVG